MEEKKALLVPDSHKAKVRNGNSINMKEDTIEID